MVIRLLADLATALISVILSLLRFLVGLFPSLTYPDFSSYVASSGLSTYFGYLNWFFPVSLAFNIAVTWIAAVLLFNVVMIFWGFLKSLIP